MNPATTAGDASMLFSIQNAEQIAGRKLPGDQMGYVKENLVPSLRVAPYLGSYYLPVKGKEGSPLKDPRVPQALSMVIDRGDAAKKLLEEAGVAPGSLTVELLYNTSENNKDTMAAVADAFSTIGVKGELNEVEGATHFNYLREDGPYDIARAGWIGDYNDLQNFIFLFGSGINFNYAQWSNTDCDALVAKAAGITDLGERAKVLAEAETLFRENVPAFPILYYASRALLAPSSKAMRTICGPWPIISW